MTNLRDGAVAGLAGLLGLLAACFALPRASAQDGVEPILILAKFERERASRDARQLANWIVHSGDNHAGDSRKVSFVILDKKDARLFVFDANGRLRGAGPALLGLGVGDTALPGIGDRELRSIAPKDRTTPAGRFVASIGPGWNNEDVLWVDHEGAIAIHRVITTNPKERRLQRLATASPHDNRISYGCINVPVKFYDYVIRPAFEGTHGIVYVMPETRPVRPYFSAFDVEGEGDDEKGAAAPTLKKVPAAKRKPGKVVK